MYIHHAMNAWLTTAGHRIYLLLVATSDTRGWHVHTWLPHCYIVHNFIDNNCCEKISSSFSIQDVVMAWAVKQMNHKGRAFSCCGYSQEEQRKNKTKYTQLYIQMSRILAVKVLDQVHSHRNKKETSV